MKQREKLMTIDVLGTKYNVYWSDADHDDKLKSNDGYVMPERKLIVLDRRNRATHQEHIFKHEIVHAFLYEGGLSDQSWAENEEIVDWIALQLFKLANLAYDSLKKLKPFYSEKKETKDNG